MRIISGKFRGKNLTPPKEENIRPTLDMVKQALFTRLQFQITGATVLDLFCGSGALGIEAISRNAKKVVFVDNNTKSINLTKKNLASIGYKLQNDIFISQPIKMHQNITQNLHITEIYILNKNFSLALQQLAKQNQKFDIILIDPPYEQVEFYIQALKLIKQLDLLCEDGIIICERLKQTNLQQEYFALEATKIYGTVALDYFIDI